MPENKEEKKIFSLLEVATSVEKTLATRYTSSFWVKAEMNKLNFYNHSGHCYPDLVEKKDGKVIAQLRAVLWKSDFLRINKNFLETLKEPLKDGIKILFLARLSFTPLYGLTLTISDIDPSYTLGDLAQEKIETIRKLQSLEIFRNNQNLKFPSLPQRIAVISVETSKGYADFLKIIETNPWGYKFFLMLFPAVLQGEKAAFQITQQLKKIKMVKHHFDVVIIVRGGGGDVGLSCYNDFNLASEIATFPIPVLTGIGHATNLTVSEIVAFTNAITPSKLAEYLLQKFHDVAVPVKEAEKSLAEKAQRILQDENTRLYSEVKLFRSVTENVLNSNSNNIRNSNEALRRQSRSRLIAEKEIVRSYGNLIRKDSMSLLSQFKVHIFSLKEKLQVRTALKIEQNHWAIENIEKNINNMNPENVLKRGYSISLINGKPIKDLKKIKKGDTLQTIIYEGEIGSKVIEIIKPLP